MSRIPSLPIAGTLLAGLLGYVGTGRAAAQANGSTHSVPVPELSASRSSVPLSIDGRLDEADWATAPPATDFRQAEPREGEPATQRTEVRFLFDGDAVYVGARMFDDQGAKGVTTRLVRRDAEYDSDHINVRFDTYHDHLGHAFFSVNPSGAKGDALSNGPGGGDSSWDPVWEAAAQIDSLGWTAEMRIPYSQLRYASSARQTWGLQVDRQVTRLNERSQWAFWGQTESGGPSRFGHLNGLEIPRHSGRMELLPYAVAQAASLAPGSAEDPFYRSSEQVYRTGLDLKYLLTSNLTLSATINPDFGQVEVDPAVVNLSAFETFFQEKRPFFVEGSGYFGFAPLWCHFCSNVSSLGLFYSRRIGRTPQGNGLAQQRGDYADVPTNTTILGAAKITGKTRGGWSIAALDAVTAREEANLANRNGERFGLEVEPLTNYFVSRVKRDLRGGNVVLGGLATSTIRDLDSPGLAERLTRHAESVGLDAEVWWKKRTYRLMTAVALSGATGDSSAILRIQRSSARYFQRPDRENGSNTLFSDGYDPGAIAMRGYGLYSRLSKEAGDWNWEVQTNVRSPGFEVNDIAFLTRADYVWMNANLARQYTKPTRHYRRLALLGGGQQQFNYDGDRTDLQGHAFGYVQLPSYWELSAFTIHRPAAYDDRLTRGGPTVRRDGFWFYALNLFTDSRKKLSFSTHPNVTDHAFGTDYSVNLNLRYRPLSNVSLSLGPGFESGTSGYQYVDARDDPTATAFGGRRFVFANLAQRTLSMDTRLNVTFTPDLSLEMFAQPFISSGEYSSFKEYDAPRSLAMSVYGRDVGEIQTIGTGGDRRYRIDPDGAGPAARFTVDDPDFNFRSLRGNAVLRWEYRPGSTLFLVWTQDRNSTAPFGDLRFDRDRSALFDARPNNIFLLKVNYWLSR